MLERTTILGVHITNESSDEISEYVFDHVRNSSQGLFIATPNPEIIVYAQKHTAYKSLLNQANLLLPDGVGVFAAGWLCNTPFKQRIPGVDFMEELCCKSVEKAVSIGLLGGKPGIAKQTAECLRKKYPGIKIAFVGTEWPDTLVDTKTKKKQDQLSDAIDILFVAFGFPKQEEWIAKNLSKIPVKAAMGVGGAFDYISGTVPRAPYLIRAMGFEWLFRLIRQPWRFRRQVALLKFIYLLLKEKIAN